MNRRSPYTATLSMTADMRAETGEGLAGWAKKSHLWKGMIPALMAKPTKRARNAAVASGAVSGVMTSGAMANEPVSTKSAMIPSITKRVESWVITK